MAEGSDVLTETVPQSPVARFVFPLIQDNPNGWGPIEVPEQFKDTPYQPFSKDNRLGKVNSIIDRHRVSFVIHTFRLLTGPIISIKIEGQQVSNWHVVSNSAHVCG